MNKRRCSVIENGISAQQTALSIPRPPVGHNGRTHRQPVLRTECKAPPILDSAVSSSIGAWCRSELAADTTWGPHGLKHPNPPGGEKALLTGQRPADVLNIQRTNLHDGALWIVQNKTGTKRAIELTCELVALIERINARPRERLSAWLIQDDCGKPLGTVAMRAHFDEARTLAGLDSQFWDIRAKAAAGTGDLAHSQKLLGHRNREMTEHYVRTRTGERVAPPR